MITSALIQECRREFGDQPTSIRLSRNGDGTTNLFNTGRFPVIEGSYVVKRSGSAITEGDAISGYTIDLDNGDIELVNTPSNGVPISIDGQYAHWRDKNWLEAINGAISQLNARGFFRQAIREAIYLSAGVRSFSGPTNAVDAYELLYYPQANTNPVKLGTNWSYQQDANKFVLGQAPNSKLSGAVSYLRNLRTYSTTSATIDTLDDWLEIIKKKAGATYYRSLAGKIAKQGNATVDEGHFSFTNLRTMANDLDNEFERLALRKKPTRPAKDIQWQIDGGGNA